MHEEALNAIQVGELLPTKENAAMIGKAIVKRCADGEVDPLQTLARLKGIQAAIDIAEAGIKPLILDDVQKQGKAGVSVLAAKIETMESGVKYDYSDCPEWVELSRKEAEIVKERKEREKFLRSITKPIDIVDKDSGEVRVINPPIKTSTTTLKVTLG